MARLVLSLLGSFQVALDQQPITGFESVKVRALLAYLASEASRPHRREAVAALLWPDWPPQSATNNLRYALADLRKNIGDRDAKPPYFLINRETIHLNRDADLWVDMTEFESAVAGSSITTLQSAVRLYRGSFLEGFSLRDSAPFEEWLLAKREYLSQQMLKSLGRLAEACIDQRDYEQAEGYARRQIEMEPWREKAYQQLMHALNLRGERVQALALFENLRKALQRELKVEPSEESIQLYGQIRDGKVEVRKETVIKEISQVVETPILVLSEKPRHNLPRLLTTFIGREKEQKEIIRLVEQNRLVMLTGAGGIGKTRLSQRVGHTLLNDYPDGVWFIALDSLSDPALVPQTVASIFDIRESQNQPVIEILKDVLRQKTALLILDNCEHLPEACAQLITALLMNCPNLAILATSRETLNVAGEAIYSMPSLSIPEQDASLAELSEYESVKLFTERAALTVSSFTLTKENIHTVADICRRVDGIPLAIELAAARVNILTVEEILKQLQDSFSLLAGGGRIGIQRHQTLRASMDWSWGLLSEAEQIFLRQLSIFAGGWTLEAARAVCEGDVLGLTSALVNKSLIAVDREEGRATRYRFHEIVRQYAREKLIESGSSEPVRNRHLAYFVKLAERAEHQLYRSDQVRWQNRLWDELDNLRMALEWALATDSESGLRLIVSSRLFWDVRGDIREAEGWLAQLLEQYRGADALRAHALVIYSQAMMAREELVKARVIAEQSLELSRAISDQSAEAFSLWGLGAIFGYQSNSGQEIPLMERSLTLYQSLGDKFGQAQVLAAIGSRLAHENPSDNNLLLESLRLYRELGHLSAIALCLCDLAHKAIRGGDFSSPVQWLTEARTLYRQLGSQLGEGYVLQASGLLAYFQGDFDQACACYEEAIKLTGAYGRITAWDQASLAYAVLRQGDILRAKKIFGLCIQLFQNHTSGLAFTIEGLASLHVEQKQPERAARLFAWVDATRVKIYYPRPPVEQAEVDRDLAVIHSQISDTAFEQAYESGKAMTLEEAVAFALSDVEPWPGTRSLYKQIHDGKLEVRKEAATTVEIPLLAEKPSHNLPRRLTTFIGREREQAEIAQRLARHRLVTLTGSGGVGKSRLALQVAESVLSDYPNGVWLVELAPLTDPALVPQAVCMALDVTPPRNSPALNVLTNYLRSRKILLVMDNCEHLIDACAQLTETLLLGCPDLRILATSREALAIEGENAYRVPSLSLADPNSQLQTIEQAEAAQLFVERARIVLPEYALTEANASTIAQICQRLDGIALAIELAAARVKMLKADQIAARLDDAFRLLTGGNRTALPRHKTLGAMIDWSYNLLSEAEQALLCRLSVFMGGWTLEAAEAVCGNDDTLVLLTHLADKSLVIVDREQGKDTRYYLLETIRQYGREKLAQGGEGEQIRKQHLDYFLKLALEADQNLKGTKYMESISRLEEEHANLLATLEWSFENSIEQGQQLVGALWWSWYLRGYRSLGDQWIQKALAVCRDTPDPIQAKLLAARAVWWDDESAKMSAQQSIAIYRQLEDHEGIAFSLITLGQKALLHSEYEQAINFLDESLRYCKEAGNMWEIRQTVIRLGWVAQLRGNYEQAETLYQEGLALSREANDPDCISWVLSCLGELAAVQGNYARARAFFEEGLSIARAAKLRSQASRSLANLGRISIYVGDLEKAWNLTEQALKIGREIDDKTAATLSLRRLGKIAALMGDHPKARSFYVESLLLARKIANIIEIAVSIIYIGHYKLSRGFPKEFARLLGMAEGIAPEARMGEEHHLFKVETEQAVESARAALGEEAYNATYRAGHAMSLEQAVAYALEVLQQ